MPATGPELTRRALLLAALASRLRADSADDVWDLLGSMASDLSAAHAVDFLAAFDQSMNGYQELRTNILALLEQGEVQSSLDLISNEGDDKKRTVEVDWLLRITVKDAVSGAVKRQQEVKCGFEKAGKHWRVVSLEPLAFFAPPRVG